MAFVVPVVCSALHVGYISSGKIYDREAVPEKGAALVLGAQAYPTRPSNFLAARLDVGIALFQKKKVSTIIVSGDGRARANNEPLVMRRYLEERGIPAEAILEDPGGYDTYDSCSRALHTYGHRSVILVSQDFHLRRALTICHSLGLDAVAVADETMRSKYPAIWFKGAFREPFANLKMEFDLVTRRDPAAGYR